ERATCSVFFSVSLCLCGQICRRISEIEHRSPSRNTEYSALVWRRLAYNLTRRLVEEDVQQPGMAELAVHRPLDEGDLHDDLGAHPVRAHARQPDGLGERPVPDLDPIQPPPKVE